MTVDTPARHALKNGASRGRPVPQQSDGVHALIGLAQATAATTAIPVVRGDLKAPAYPVPARMARETEAPARQISWSRLVTGPWPLLCVLAVQAVLALRLTWSNTAFTDEALYLWAGHLEWAHLLHGVPLPPFATYFSGAPVLYPPIAALADSIGGLAGARILSLGFMLGATCLLWATTSRLFGKRAAFFGAALFALLGPVIKLGAFATYDPMTLFLIAAATWCAVRASERQEATGWAAVTGLLLMAANATKYASLLFDPVVLLIIYLAERPKPNGKPALMRAAFAAFIVLFGLLVLYEIGTLRNGYYLSGIEQTTLSRAVSDTPAGAVINDSLQWVGVAAGVAAAGVVLALVTRARQTVLLAVLAGAALLVPLEQARIHTVTSLDKHVAFGAWFACIAAGYAVARVTEWRGRAAMRITATALLALVLAAYPAREGFSQARGLYGWANVSSLIPALRSALAGVHGNVLIDAHSDAEYYLYLGGGWKQWSSTASIIEPSGRAVGYAVGVVPKAQPYLRLIRRGYFKVIELDSFAVSPLTREISDQLAHEPTYRMVASGPYGLGHYTIWKYEPSSRNRP